MSLYEIRTKLGLTQPDMARKLGMSVKAYWCAEKSPNPKKTILLAAKYIQMTEK